MIQTWDPRPHKWIALTSDNKFICAFDTLRECFDKAKEKYGDDFYTAYGVLEDYKKEE